MVLHRVTLDVTLLDGDARAFSVKGHRHEHKMLKGMVGGITDTELLLIEVHKI